MKKIISFIIPIFLVGCSITWIRPMEVEHNHNFKSIDKLVKKLESCLAHAGYEITVATPTSLETKLLEIEPVGYIRIAN